MLKIVKYLIVLLVAIALIVVVRGLLHRPSVTVLQSERVIALDESRLITNLSASLVFPTISFQESNADGHVAFAQFQNWLAHTYPDFHHTLELQKFNQTLLFKWQGTDATLQPVLVTGHYDVVPVIPGTEGLWTHPPFSGHIEDGYIWGRGALDDKSGVIGMVEAATYLLARGYQPLRTIYFSFGHDEEIGGAMGAGLVADYLKKQGVQLLWSLDEGSFLLDGFIPGIDTLVAAINVAEKGSLTLQLVGKSEGGHSSMPPPQTAAGILAEAITKLEQNPMPGGLEGLSLAMFDTLSREMPFINRLLFANRWLFGGLIDRSLEQSPPTNAMLRTTTAVTMLSGSVKVNVLPIEATAMVNFRLHPRDTVEEVVAHVNRVVADENVDVRRVNFVGWNGQAASTVSSWDAVGFSIIEQSVLDIYPNAIVAPGLMVAASDSRHYSKVADNAYRFNPFPISSGEFTGFHGTNERISSASFISGVKVYIGILESGSSR
jgi:carboxypeptidase PM20D1